MGVIADRFNAAHGAEYGQIMSDKWIAHVVRKSLRLSTRKSNGVFIVPVTEKPKIDALSSAIHFIAAQWPACCPLAALYHLKLIL